MAMVKNRSTGSRIFNVCNIAFFALVMIVCILPVWHVFCASFSNASWVMNQRGLIWHIEGFTFNGYQLVFNDNSIWTGYLNTFIYVIGTTVLGMFLTVMAAYALSRKDFIWANPLMLIISFTMLFSGGIVTLYILVTQTLNMYDSRWALILPVLTNAWSLIVAKSFLDSIPAELEESAKIDGCTDLGVFFRIIIPLSTASIATLTLFFAVSHWNTYFNALIYLTDLEKRTLQVYVKSLLIDASTTGMGTMNDIMNMPSETVRMATVILAMLPILVVYPFLQKYFVKGVMVGSIKG